MECVKYEECLKKIRPNNVEKIKILKNLNYIINNEKIYFFKD